MNTNLFFLSTLLLTAGLLAGCSKDDDQTNAAPRRISVEVSERPMTPDDPAAARSLTRASIIETSTLPNFWMRGFYSSTPSEYTVTQTAGVWSVTPNTWPGGSGNEGKTPFYAYTGGTFYPNTSPYSDKPYVDFTVSEDAFEQNDLLVATNNLSYSECDGKVPLTFDHACAALAFNVQMTNTLSSNLSGKTLTVSSIVLKNVSKVGYYHFDTNAWSDIGAINEGVKGGQWTDYTLTNSSMDITTTLKALPCNYLFVIPQSRAANGTSGTYLEINYTFEGQTATQATISLDVNWAKGTQYTINIKLGTTLIK